MSNKNQEQPVFNPMPKTRINKSATFMTLIIIVLLFILGWIAFAHFSGIYQNINSRWSEIQFAYDHPNIVKTTREEYASKSAQLDQSFMVKEEAKGPTPEQQLLEQVAKKLEGSK